MSIKDQLGEQNWRVIFNAMSAASSYVSTASGGGMEAFKEIFSASKFAQELWQKEGGSGYGEIVDELLSDMKDMPMKQAKRMAIKFESKDVEGIRYELKQVVADAAASISGLPGEEGFKQWLLDMARRVAETRTGGFLGIGGKAVIDEQEEAAIGELADILGV